MKALLSPGGETELSCMGSHASESGPAGTDLCSFYHTHLPHTGFNIQVVISLLFLDHWSG